MANLQLIRTVDVATYELVRLQEMFLKNKKQFFLFFESLLLRFIHISRPRPPVDT